MNTCKKHNNSGYDQKDVFKGKFHGKFWPVLVSGLDHLTG